MGAKVFKLQHSSKVSCCRLLKLSKLSGKVVNLLQCRVSRLLRAPKVSRKIVTMEQPSDSRCRLLKPPKVTDELVKVFLSDLIEGVHRTMAKGIHPRIILMHTIIGQTNQAKHLSCCALYKSS